MSKNKCPKISKQYMQRKYTKSKSILNKDIYRPNQKTRFYNKYNKDNDMNKEERKNDVFKSYVIFQCLMLFRCGYSQIPLMVQIQDISWWFINLSPTYIFLFFRILDKYLTKKK